MFFAVKVPMAPCPGRRREESSADCCVTTRPLVPLVTPGGCALADPFQRA
ncbi:hypothetical protein [Clavibacter capsici]|nr:hypothetical protein [Clavibacter capsici]